MPESGAQLLITLAMIPTFGFCFVMLAYWAIDGKLHPGYAFCGASLLAFLNFVAISTPNSAVKIGIMLIIITGVAFFPYASTQFERAELQAVDVMRLEKAHKALAKHSDNIAVRFDIAKTLYDYGLPGHAIAIAETTLRAIDATVDPTANTSMRNLFMNEAQKVKFWRKNLTDPNAFEPVKCHACGTMNPVGNIACVRCKGPFLLELARRENLSQAMFGKLVLGWGMSAAALGGGLWALTTLPLPWSAIILVASLVIAGVLLSLLFRDRSKYKQIVAD
ncbi:MAG: hypothetical protein HONBIEJF_01874 [Fimbriimonadaceae bacterium]|nr:hypothetical protein [Fimbriimonadaceae bacterium]